MLDFKSISIHAPRVGSDCLRLLLRLLRSVFQSTLPVWGATLIGLSSVGNFLFQSTLPVWGATPLESVQPAGRPISIHAPRVGSDSSSMRSRKCELDFNPRSPCGERPGQGRIPRPVLSISIHAPRVGSDVLDLSSSHTTSLFQSTLPVWGATWWGIYAAPQQPQFQSTLPVWGATASPRAHQCTLCISIHAPRVGSDFRPLRPQSIYMDFNPRSPCGERHRFPVGDLRHHQGFQSTLPVWGATAKMHRFFFCIFGKKGIFL